MRIESCDVAFERIPLQRPFPVAHRTMDCAELAIVRLRSGAHEGIGVGAPLEWVTGEAFGTTQAALSGDFQAWITGQSFTVPAPLARAFRGKARHAPAACAAVDIALHDLWAKSAGKPLVDLLGRAHDGLPTSVTLAIRPIEESLREARAYLDMGYTVLKVKGGEDLEHDVELLTRLRENHGGAVSLRSDLNQGYDLSTLSAFFKRIASLGVEFIEQPLPVNQIQLQRKLPEELRARLAMDENLQDEKSAIALAVPPAPGSIFNIKLMKCGGILPALSIAAIGEAAGFPLMWGCMIESVAGISAALHTALACPGTRYLDLDGHLDLAYDVAESGMIFEKGILRTRDVPGIGAKPR